MARQSPKKTSLHEQTEDTSLREPIVELSIKLSADKEETIYMFVGEMPERVVAQFCEKHQLPNDIMELIYEQLIEQMEIQCPEVLETLQSDNAPQPDPNRQRHEDPRPDYSQSSPLKNDLQLSKTSSKDAAHQEINFDSQHFNSSLNPFEKLIQNPSKHYFDQSKR